MVGGARRKLSDRKRERARVFLLHNLENDAVLYHWDLTVLSLMVETAEKWLNDTLHVPNGLDGDPLRVFTLRFAQAVDIKHMHDMLSFTESPWFKAAVKEAKVRYPPVQYPPK